MLPDLAALGVPTRGNNLPTVADFDDLVVTDTPYIPRDIDTDLTAALDVGDEFGFVVVAGPAAAGKTRTALEALSRARGDSGLVVVRDPGSLRSVLRLVRREPDLTIWLDRLERFISPGCLDLAQLDVHAIGTVILGTLRSSTRRTIADRVLGRAKTFYLPREPAPSEKRRAAEHPDSRIASYLDQPGAVGLAEHIAGAPATLQHWRSALGGDHPLAGAVISAAIDCRRAGMVHGIPTVLLRALAPTYLDHPVGDFDEALAWACRPVSGAQAAALYHLGLGSPAFDEMAQWFEAAMAAGSPDAAFSYATACEAAGLDDQALEIYRRGAAAGDPHCMTNLGRVLADLGDREPAIRWTTQAAGLGD
ncbi:sel1 repeat family protein [Actinokineospora inagensis]|uniref:sel1 repeat family protein n=1 Tax=Actinokineospora inagensis TaxID=103730 RepID=UPI000412337B|nr:sel1 repeat family protein [Actinokineospora inagensis]